MSAFDKAFEATIGHEGGYVNDPRDRGGETKFGISARAYPNLKIADLTIDQAKDIYRKDYWTVCGCDALPEPVALAVFDLAVNAGVRAAVRDLQQALGVPADGVLGPQTQAALARVRGELEILRLAVRVHAYGLIRRTDAPTWSTHGKGWARRVAKNLVSA
jgi:lysozyme family protein